MRVVMKCGHVAIAKDHHEGTPVCPICLVFTQDAFIPMNPQPNLRGRIARCIVCEEERQSDVNLPYFQYTEEGDNFFCGCKGDE